MYVVSRDLKPSVVLIDVMGNVYVYGCWVMSEYLILSSLYPRLVDMKITLEVLLNVWFKVTCGFEFLLMKYLVSLLIITSMLLIINLSLFIFSVVFNKMADCLLNCQRGLFSFRETSFVV